MRVAICGANGFLGKHLSSMFVQDGNEVVRIGREHFKNQDVLRDSLEGAHIIINLCGESFFKKWDELYKHNLYVSRIETTKKLAQAIGMCQSKPYAFIASSSVQIYKEDMIHDDYSTQYGTNYLALLIKEYENECQKIKTLGLRTIIFRYGYILAEDAPFFQFIKKAYIGKLGFFIGEGDQILPWIYIKDVLNLVTNAINDLSFEGVYNLTAEHVEVKKFFKLYGKFQNKITFTRYPEIFLRLNFGEGVQNLLHSYKIISKRIEEDGYSLQFETLEKTLEDIFQKK